jgi:hypothetical protein
MLVVKLMNISTINMRCFSRLYEINIEHISSNVHHHLIVVVDRVVSSLNKKKLSLFFYLRRWMFLLNSNWITQKIFIEKSRSLLLNYSLLYFSSLLSTSTSQIKLLFVRRCMFLFDLFQQRWRRCSISVNYARC